MRIAIIENGKIVNVVEAEEGLECCSGNIGDLWDGLNFTAPEENNLFIIVSMSGGDGRTDPVGVANDGVESLDISIAIKDKAGFVMPISGSWRIILRSSDGSEYETLAVTLTNGQASFNYTTTGKTGEVSINSSDLTEKFDIGGKTYGLKVAGDSNFKVYRRI